MCYLPIQAEEAKQMKLLLKRKKAETMRLLEMEKRQKQRVEEIRETQKKVWQLGLYCCLSSSSYVSLSLSSMSLMLPVCYFMIIAYLKFSYYLNHLTNLFRT